MVKITLKRGIALERGPEEEKVLGTYQAVKLYYSMLMVVVSDGIEIQLGYYDDEVGGWHLNDKTWWSDIYVEAVHG